MASKLEFILNVLERNEFRHLKDSLPKPREKNFRDSPFSSACLAVYKELGGIAENYPWKPPAWDLEFETFALKLDEAADFNRYRGITLKSSLYDQLNFFNLESYKRYCRQYEQECLKAARHSGMWTDKESEKQFGESEAAGDLAFKGAAKWKERAFYSFLEDVAVRVLNIKLIRVSIYDNLMVNNKLVKLDNLLTSQSAQNEKYLWNYLSRKINTGPV